MYTTTVILFPRKQIVLIDTRAGATLTPPADSRTGPGSWIPISRGAYTHFAIPSTECEYTANLGDRKCNGCRIIIMNVDRHQLQSSYRFIATRKRIYNNNNNKRTCGTNCHVPVACGVNLSCVIYFDLVIISISN